MVEWTEFTFSDFVEINPAIRIDGHGYVSFVEMRDLNGGERWCRPRTERKAGSGSKFQNADTLFAKITPCLENGKICQVTDLKGGIGFGSTEFLVFRGRPEISDSDFVYYLSRSTEVRDFAEMNFEGTSGRQRVPKSCFENLKLVLPSLPEQKAIAEVLGSFDEKIDLLHRQNKTLESLAQTIFRQWFIEEADRSWENGVITDLIELNPKRILSKGTVTPYLEMSNLSNSLYHPTDWYDREFSSGTKFINGDTLLARITPCLENGKTGFVDFLEAEQVGWGSTEFIVMRAKEPLHPFFSYILARHQDFRDFAIGCMVGSSGRQRADVDNLATYEMKIPSANVMNRFNGYIEPSLQKMKLNNKQIRDLVRLRDSLLPKLMSGELIAW